MPSQFRAKIADLSRPADARASARAKGGAAKQTVSVLKSVMNEIDTLRALDHPSLCKLLDHFLEGEQSNTALEQRDCRAPLFRALAQGWQCGRTPRGISFIQCRQRSPPWPWSLPESPTGKAYLVMELLTGGDLAQLLNAR